MTLKTVFILTISVIIFSGCSAKTKGFIEDLYSSSTTRSAQQHDYTENSQTIRKRTTRESTTQTNEEEYSNNGTEVYTATGKIIDASYDKDVNLYIYVFMKNGDPDPRTFYYNKDLRPIGEEVTITVKENFLTKISTTEKHKRILKKRIKSNLKTPIIEKIDTL